MIDFLLGVPGKLKTISDYLITNWTVTRAAKIDNLDAAITTRAAAAGLTALEAKVDILDTNVDTLIANPTDITFNF